MKIIVAPDSYKNCMRSIEVADTIAKGLKKSIPGCEVLAIPMADGGEGTMDAVVYFCGGSLEKMKVRDPFMREIEAAYGVLSETSAVFEMAQASGIELVGKAELDPMRATTYGSGEILCELIRSGKKDIVIGIGGSATCDGGAGFLQALGVEFFDTAGTLLAPGLGGGGLDKICRVNAAALKRIPAGVRIRIACDVNNLLTGERGSARIFGPQKGATPAMVEQLDRNLAHFHKVMQQTGLAGAELPGDGAAGGLGFALQQILGGKLESGGKLMLELSNMRAHLAQADLIVTGEGCTDSQTASGKLCAQIAGLAREMNKPVVLISGALRGEMSSLRQVFTACFSTAQSDCTLEEAIQSARHDIEVTAENVGALLNLR